MILDGDQALRVREHLADAQNELQQWHRDFALLLARRPRIEDRISRCKVALAPYKKLPVEITREIILFVVDVPPDFPLAKEVVLDPRVQITHVCADWRQIAFDTPELWRITLSRIPDRSSVSKLINAWWSQCPGSQLSLLINEPYLQEPGPERQFEGISFDHFLFDHVIFPYSTRLLALKILVRAETARKMLALPAGSFKALQVLILIVDPHSDPDPSLHLDDLNTAFSSSPSLSGIAIRAHSIPDPLLLRIPWHQLTFLALSTLVIPADLALLLLSYCPLLSTCFINAVKDIDADMVTRIVSTPVLCLTDLTILRIIFAGSLNHHQFLRALSLPKLHSLALSLPRSHDWAAPNYAAFLRSTTSTLSLFQFRLTDPKNSGMNLGIGIPSDDHMDELLLSYMPQVELFDVVGGFPISPSALEKIAHGELLPSATDMQFRVDDLRPLLEMLEARLSRSHKSSANGRTMISTIRNIVVHCSSTGSDMEDMIQGLKDKGVNIVIHVNEVP